MFQFKNDVDFVTEFDKIAVVDENSETTAKEKKTYNVPEIEILPGDYWAACFGSWDEDWRYGDNRAEPKDEFYYNEDPDLLYVCHTCKTERAIKNWIKRNPTSDYDCYYPIQIKDLVAPYIERINVNSQAAEIFNDTNTCNTTIKVHTGERKFKNRRFKDKDPERFDRLNDRTARKVSMELAKSEKKFFDNHKIATRHPHRNPHGMGTVRTKSWNSNGKNQKSNNIK